MSMRVLILPVLVSCILVAASPLPALAKNNKAKADKPAISWDKDTEKVVDLAVKISLGDRKIIRDYLERDVRRNCPPGLAKKNNGCMPPGQAKKYRVGRALSRDVTARDLPQTLLDRLSSLPRGYKYGRIDDDIVVMSRENRMIVDAVSILLNQ